MYFAGNAAPGSPPPPLTQASEVERAWGLAKESTSIAVLEAFIVRYKQSFYADLARARIEELKGKQGSATVAPPAAPTPKVKPGAALATSLSKEEINEECSKRADARKLTGQARWDFRTKCKTELVGRR